MVLDEFRRIKQEMMSLYSRISELDEQRRNQNTDIVEDVDQLVERFFDLQTRLLSSDLSDIPFEEWRGVSLVSDDVLDFSKTHANIDFSLLGDVFYSAIKLNGCNVRGVRLINYDENTFDEEFIKSNPQFFPDESIPKEIRDKFFHKEIDFSDLVNYPSLKNVVTDYSFGEMHRTASADLVKAIGLENALKMFEENPEFITFITSVTDFVLFKFSYKSFDKDSSYDEAKKFIYGQVIEVSKSYEFSLSSLETVPQEMKDMFPNVFIKDGELPEAVTERYYSGQLLLSDLRDYKSVLINKDLQIGTKYTYECLTINKVYGSVWSFFDKVPKQLEFNVSRYLLYLTADELNQMVTKSNDEIIRLSIYDSMDRDIYSFTDLDTIAICSQYVPIEVVITDENICKFIEKCGLTNLQEYNRKHNYILDRHLSTSKDIENTILGCMAKISEKVDKDYTFINEDEFDVFLEKNIHEMRKSGDNVFHGLLDKNKRYLSKVFPNEFLDYDLLDKLLENIDENKRKSTISYLERGFNGDVNTLLRLINSNPEFISVFEGKNLIVDEKDIRFKKLYDVLGSKKTLEVGSMYGSGLVHILNDLTEDDVNDLIIKLQSNEDYIQLLNSKVYSMITSTRKFDIRDLPTSFKEQYPELYLKEDAPDDLKQVFYGTSSIIPFMLIGPLEIYEHPEWVQHLKHINLNKCLADKKTNVYNSNDGYENHFVQSMSLYEALAIKFSQEEILKILSQYGDYLNNNVSINIYVALDKQQCYDNLLNSMYQSIVRRLVFYTEQTPEEFKQKYSDIFLEEDAPEELKNLFYRRKISPGIIQQHPEWIKFLVNKNIKAVCDNSILSFVISVENLKLDNKELFNLFIKYGNYLVDCSVRIQGNNKDNIDDVIKKQIIESITEKRIRYNEDAKIIIGEECPELFLDENAPDELKKCFYNYAGDTPLTFELLKQHREWLPFLQDKNVLLSLKKKNVGIRGLEQLFERYGDRDALKIGMKNPESVMKMLEHNKFELFSQWYEKLNFIPHYVVMLDFPIEKADMFIASGKKWSQLMRIERYNLNEESKSALLKASMCFGVFDNDMDGFNKTMKLFTDIPKTLSEEDMLKVVEYLNNKIGLLTFNMDYDVDEEKLAYEYKNQLELLNKVYSKNSDGSYSLKINLQQNRDIVNILRGLMESASVSTVLTPDRAHKLFGGFAMKYEPEFRDFILSNMDTILTSDEYISYISSMQKQWSEIKALNSNRVLTLDLALACVRANNYENVQVGNDRLAEVSNQAGYSQQDFDTLQQIYNYGKMRVFSSIPRIESKTDKYTYEVLRLDDPLAVAIGTLTDCCQELGNAAEACMEHSMVDKHGRVFVIKDNDGNMVAQSWMWRNRNVVCFDNIEIPDKAFTRAERSGMSKEEFVNQIHELYQQAAEELIEVDKLKYTELLENGMITQEQYEALTIGKVTVGIGNNDIAKALEKNAKKDTGTVASPMGFEPPVGLSRGLYTNDSVIQYVLAGNEHTVPSSEQNLMLYQDEFKVYDDSNTKQQDILTLQKLEYITKRDLYNGKTQSEDKESLISDIAYNYNFNPETTRVIMNANFAIVYDVNEEEIVLGDILYNTSIDINGRNIDITDKVIMQIRMAIEQIAVAGKKFNINRLTQEQLDMYNRAMNLNEEIDMERGLVHGSR